MLSHPYEPGVHHLVMVYAFFYVVGFGLLISWEFLCLYSSVILACNFWWYLCMVLVSGWWWLPRMCLEVFLPLQSFGRVWENSQVSQFVCVCVCGRSFITLKKDRESFWQRHIDIRRGDRDLIYFHQTHSHIRLVESSYYEEKHVLEQDTLLLYNH